ncbi:MAG TPA: extracellular solute-binding protein, partial [Polyangiaceae bacterium]|nr:extracellular solute-binding protein [Polyangiaceae bacterium]
MNAPPSERRPPNAPPARRLAGAPPPRHAAGASAPRHAAGASPPRHAAGAPPPRRRASAPAALARALACALVALVALASAPARAAEPVTLWHSYREDGTELKALAQSLDAFRKITGAEIRVLAVPFDGYASKLTAAIPSGNGPDIYIDAHERIGDYRVRGIVAPVGDALPPGDEPAYAQSSLAAVRLDGKLYGIPLSRKCIGLYINDALMSADPPDLESLGDLAPKLPPGVVPLAHFAGNAYFHAPFLTSFGGSMLGPGDAYGLDSEAGRRSVDFVAELTRRKIIPEETSGALVTDLFSSGRAAAAINGPWMAGELKSDLRYHVVPLPPLRASGRPMRPLLTVEAVLMSPQGAARPEARALARYLGSDDAADLRARIGRNVSARSAPPPSAAGDAFLVAFGRAADAAEPMPTSAAMRLVFEPTDRALRKVLRGDAPSAVALAEAGHRFDDVRRPLPPAAPPGPFALGLGALALAGAFALYRRPRPAGAPNLRASLPAYAYVALAVAAVLVLVVVPLAVGAATSFFAGRGETMRFVGLAHYVNILTARGGPLLATGSFYLVLLVTVFWTVCNVVLHVGIGVSLGLLLSRERLRGKAIYRVLLIVPWAVPSYVTALAWKGLFHRQYGAVNALLGLVGVEPVAWFARFSTAFAANLSTNVWLGFPFMMVVTMGALTAVPKDVLEAAAVDGATPWERLRLVTLPLIRPALAPAVALGAIWTFNMFNVVFLVSGGDPDGTTDILVSEAYRWAFTREAQIGYAAAYSVLIFLLLAGSTRLSERLAARA